MAYAETTSVPVAKTRGEIEALLAKFKCTQFVIGSDHELRQAMVQFRANNRIVRFTVALPNPDDKAIKYDRNGWNRPEGARQKVMEQVERSRWRALMLVIKAKLESVESQIATFEQEFLAHIVMPSGQTVGDLIVPQIADVYEKRGGQLLLEEGQPVGSK